MHARPSAVPGREGDLAALGLFRQAAEQERATAELAAQVVSYLRKARHEPGLRFERG